jgi:hypothetical protein
MEVQVTSMEVIKISQLILHELKINSIMEYLLIKHPSSIKETLIELVITKGHSNDYKF